jgi:protein phosphatase 1 regulatory subunit 11
MATERTASSSVQTEHRDHVVGNLETRLHLRASQEPEEQIRRSRVRWEEGTIDNEFMDKKKSKGKCI